MLIAELAIFLAAAIVAVPLFKRLGLGSVLGYLAAGAVIGPSGLGLIHGVEEKMHLAEFGVVLLLFLIGLELAPARLWKLRGAVFGLGGAQMLGTGAILVAAGLVLGLGFAPAVVVGVALSLSSTAFVLQLLGERNELASPHGRAAFGILLFQDLAAIPLLAIVPALAASSAPAVGGNPLLKVATVVGVFIGLVLAGRYLMRPLFRIVASARSQELSTGFALLVVIGTALLMQKVGLSMALGAFLAGVLLAESEYRHELEADIEPFKGLLLGLFFTSVGMSADLALVIERPAAVAGLVAGLTVAKLGATYLIARILGHRADGAARLAIALSQGGEFAFVIFGLAARSHVIPGGLASILVVGVSLSMVLTPLLFLAYDRWSARAGARQPQQPYDAIDPEEGQVIIAGFGRFGQIVARLLRANRIPFTALEANMTQVDFVRRFGSKVYYGDASRLELLRAAKADRARLFVLAIDDPEVSVRTAQTVIQHFPKAKILARARNRQHLYALMALGIDNIVREVFFSSLQLAQRALEELGLPISDAREAVRKFQEHDEAQAKEQFKVRDDEEALIATARQAAQDLEKIFEKDASTRI
jgi:monovalent cation:proton antiporter-2 (CPA2) family protein